MHALRLGWVVLPAATLACGDLTPDIHVDRPSAPATSENEAGDPVAGAPPRTPIEALPAASRPEGRGHIDIDWTVETVGEGPPLLVPGRSTPMSFRVSNQGLDPAPPTSLSLALEANAPRNRFGQRSFELARLVVPSLDAGAAYEDTVDVFVRPSIPPSPYGLLARVDPDRIRKESDESNNERLFGSGSIRVSPFVSSEDQLLWDGLGPGCAETRTLTVRNLSPKPLRVAVSPPRLAEFEILQHPGTLGPAGEDGDEGRLEVRYRPRVEGTHVEALDFLVEGQRGLPLSVELNGQSIDTPTREDTRQQQDGPTVDLLLVVADGPGMANEWGELAHFVPTIIERLRDAKVRFRIGVARTGSPNLLLGAVVDHRQPDAIQHFSALVDQGRSEAAAAAENRTLLRTADVLVRGPFEPRREAGLAVVFLSNGDDQSPPPPGCKAGTPVEACYRQRLVDMKSGFGGVHQVTANAIIEDGSLGCSPERAQRLWHLVSDLGGTIDAVCEEDAYTAMWSFPDPRFGMPVDFGLSSNPVPGSVAVRVEGQTVPAYDFIRAANVWRVEGRTLRFLHGRQPVADALVDIQYLTRCETTN